MENKPEYRYTKITVDGRCLDLLLTEDEITTCFERCRVESNQKFRTLYGEDIADKLVKAIKLEVCLNKFKQV